MKTYIAFLFALLVGAGIGVVWGYQQGLRDGSAIVPATATPSPPRPSYICSPDDSSVFCPDPFWYLTMQEFGPV